jgi:YbbR domain-containing protein
MKSLGWNKVRDNIINFFVSEWQKKLVSLIVAALLWFYVVSLSDTEQTLSLPIDYKNLPPAMMILEKSDNFAAFQIKGSRLKIRNLSLSQTLKPVVNLENAQPGIRDYKIEIRIDEPQPNLVINLLNDRVRLKIDRMASRAILIQPAIQGTPMEGYTVDDIFLDTKIITVSGPQETLNSMNFIETKPLDLSAATNDMETNVGLELPKFVSTSEDTKIHIKIRIIKSMTNY